MHPVWKAVRTCCRRNPDTARRKIPGTTVKKNDLFI
jgi:hypothetical protein